MRRMRWIANLWPGLPQLWAHGSWSGLTLALAAGLMLDGLLLASFGWSELIASNLRTTIWVSFAVVWVIAAGWSSLTARRCDIGDPDPRKDAFAEALDYYLKGDYYQAERMLELLLRRNVRDLDARLMLATLMRHTGRLDEAARQLDTLARFEGACKWDLEMRQERELLADAKTQKATAA